MPIGLIDILRIFGFDSTIPTRLVRHQSQDYPASVLMLEPGLFELYQSYQAKPVFHKVSQVVSFYGMEGTKAGFYGVYQVSNYRAATEGQLPRSGRLSDVSDGRANFYYDMALDERFVELRERLIIDWGASTRMWRQTLTNKAVIELAPSGRKLPAFGDYLEFSISFQELKSLFASESARQDWRAPLSSVAGIYLISDELTGHLYVGSASGDEGIWGRWRAYATTGHGGNKHLQHLATSSMQYSNNFRFSILQTLPRSWTASEIRRRESIYKRKFGKRATELNGN